MLVKMRTTMAGPFGTVQAGQIADLEPGTAYGLIEKGYAVQVDGEGPETTSVTPPENADRKRSRQR